MILVTAHRLFPVAPHGTGLDRRPCRAWSAGVAVILLATGTTLNIESFMGSIMCIGVSVANSVMLTTFMGDYWRSGMTPMQAAVKGAKDRLRPVLMTAIAMMLGTIPMALALEKGSEMTAPLGRAVIGGLVVSTFATMLIVPALFVLLMKSAKNVSPSIDPDDLSAGTTTAKRERRLGRVGADSSALGVPKAREGHTLWIRRLAAEGVCD